MVWVNLGTYHPRRFTCGYCGDLVGSDRGYHDGSRSGWMIYICPSCNKPIYFESEKQTPGVIYGRRVEHLPMDIEKIYEEARKNHAIASYTGAVMLCRKILMNIAVAQSAPTGQSFIQYVEYLANNGYVPPNGKAWVDHIRKKGNEANHEIKLMGESDSQELLSFVEMLLKFIYEFPAKLPAAQ